MLFQLLIVVLLVLVTLVEVHGFDVLPLPLFIVNTGPPKKQKGREGHTPRLIVSQILFDVVSKALFQSSAISTLFK